MPAWLSLYAPIAENKKGIYKFSARFLAFSDKISTVQKKCCPRAEDRAIFEDLRLRGQGQGQGLEASRPRPRPRTSKCVLEDVLEAKDVLEDSTSAIQGLSFALYYCSFQSILKSIGKEVALRNLPKFSSFNTFYKSCYCSVESLQSLLSSQAPSTIK